MTDVYSPKMPQVTRDVERRPRPGDYRPGIPARPQSHEWAVPDGSAMNEIDVPPDRSGAMDTGTAINLRKLQEQLSRKPLDEIATLVCGLTYGEMIELSEAIWRAQPEGSTITLENFPALLHRWSKSRPAGSDISAVPPSV